MTYIVGFSRKMHLLAKAVMFFTRSDISHVYIRQEGEDGVDYVLESTHRGVNLQWHPVFLRNEAIVVHEYAVDFPVVKLNEAWAKVCCERLNRSYGWLTLLGDAYIYVRFWITGKWSKNPFGAPWKDVCSELTLAWILDAGIPGFEELDPVSVAPSDTYSGKPGILQVVQGCPEIFKTLPLSEEA